MMTSTTIDYAYDDHGEDIIKDDDDESQAPWDEIMDQKKIIERFDQLLEEKERKPNALARNAKHFPPSSPPRNGSQSLLSGNSVDEYDHFDLKDTNSFTSRTATGETRSMMSRTRTGDSSKESFLIMSYDEPEYLQQHHNKYAQDAADLKPKKVRTENKEETEKNKEREDMLKKMYQYGSGMIRSVMNPAPGVFRQERQHQQPTHDDDDHDHDQDTLSTPPPPDNDDETLETLPPPPPSSSPPPTPAQDPKSCATASMSRLKTTVVCTRQCGGVDPESAVDDATIGLNLIPDISEHRQHHVTFDETVTTVEPGEIHPDPHLEKAIERERSTTSMKSALRSSIFRSKEKLSQQRVYNEDDNQHKGYMSSGTDTKISLKKLSSWSFRKKRGGAGDTSTDDDTTTKSMKKKSTRHDVDGIASENRHQDDDDVEQQLKMLDDLVAESTMGASSKSSKASQPKTDIRGDKLVASKDENVNEEVPTLTKQELFGNDSMFDNLDEVETGVEIDGALVADDSDDDDDESRADNQSKSSERDGSTTITDNLSTETPNGKQIQRRRRIETFAIYLLLAVCLFVMIYLGLRHRSQRQSEDDDGED